ncbi:MAG: SoxR reducing system RseC family protein [Pontibacterium sp.]
MIEETGVVERIDDEGVWVETIKLSACGSCSARAGCGQSMLASVGAGKRSVICVENPNHLIVTTNDDVVIGIEEGAFLQMSALIYLVPLITLFVGAVLANYAQFHEGIVALSGVAGLAVGLLIAKVVSRNSMTSCQYKPQLIRVAR